jgi:hypothetical protein
MAGVERSLTERLKLKVNSAKSALARLQKCKFFDFSLTSEAEPRRLSAYITRWRKSDAIEKLVGVEREKLIDAAIATGKVDKDAFDSVDRLSKVATDARSAGRWLIPLILLILLTFFLVLLIKKQHETEIELDLLVSELHFHLPVHELLAKDQFLRSLSASALDGIIVDGVDWPAPKGSTCSLSVHLLEASAKKDAITLTALAPPRNWEVGVSRAGAGTDFEFTGAPMPTGEDFLLRALLRGKADLRTDCTIDGKTRHIDWDDLLIMRIGSAATLHCESDLPVEFARQIQFDNLHLYTIERVQVDAAPVDRVQSSLLSGTLYLDALNAKAVALRPFEDLTFGSSKGHIRALSFPADLKLTGDGLHLQAHAPALTGDGLHLRAHATVQKMNLGSGANKRAQMPSWLEVLTAQTGITLLWASVTYVLGMIYAALLWFKVIN